MNFKKINAWLMAVSLTATTAGSSGMPLYMDATQLGIKKTIHEETLGKNKLQANGQEKNYDVDQYGIVTKYRGEETELVLPSKKHGRSICEIGQEVFQNQKNVQSVIIPEGVQKIQKDAFFNCVSLASITIPATLTRVESGAFQNCINLKKIDLSKTTITEIEEDTFRNCKNLKEVILPDSICAIGANAFQGCGQLSSINIGDLCQLERIGSGAFGACISLTDIVIPECVKRIAGGAFANCIRLDTITIPGRVSEFGLAVLAGNSQVTVKSVINSLAYDYAVDKKLKFESISEERLVSKIELSGEKIQISKENVKKLTISQGENVSLKIEISGKATDEHMSWECNKPDIVTISPEGVITGAKKGFVIATVTAIGGVNKTDSVEISVI